MQTNDERVTRPVDLFAFIWTRSVCVLLLLSVILCHQISALSFGTSRSAGTDLADHVPLMGSGNLGNAVPAADPNTIRIVTQDGETFSLGARDVLLRERILSLLRVATTALFALLLLWQLAEFPLRKRSLRCRVLVRRAASLSLPSAGLDVDVVFGQGG